ncbi:MAG: hypothetical protein ACI4J1_08105 [Ruminiclostridium sp.]
MSKFKKIVAGILTAVMAVTSVSAVTLTASAEETPAKVVWVNGKDIKTTTKNSDGTKTTEVTHYKTTEFEYQGKYSGGKWTVLVTPTTVATVDDFVKLFDEKGKIKKDAAADLKDAKTIATAKIKEGTITVTAGKKGGDVNVWLYEYKNKKVVNADGIEPQVWKVTAKVAATGIEVKDAKSAAVKAATIEVGEKAEFTVAGTVKSGTVDAAATYTAELKKADQSANLKVEYDKGKLTLTGVKAGDKDKDVKVAVVIKNVESGKSVTFNVTVKAKAASSAA